MTLLHKPFVGTGKTAFLKRTPHPPLLSAAKNSYL